MNFSFLSGFFSGQVVDSAPPKQLVIRIKYHLLTIRGVVVCYPRPVSFLRSAEREQGQMPRDPAIGGGGRGGGGGVRGLSNTKLKFRLLYLLQYP